MATKATQEIDALISKGKKKKGGSKSGGGARKVGRSKRHPSTARYTADRRWEKNKIRRVKRHLKYQPNDRQAQGWLETNG